MKNVALAAAGAAVSAILLLTAVALADDAPPLDLYKLPSGWIRMVFRADETTVTNVVFNKGHCEGLGRAGIVVGLGVPLTFPLVKHTGDLLTIGVGACNVVEVEVDTTDGDYQYDF